MASTTANKKYVLRQQVLSELAGWTKEELRRSDDALFQHFLSLPQVEEAKVIFAYWGMPGREPETERLVKALLERGKIVGLPRMQPQRQMEVRQYVPEIPMKKAGFGIWEPGEASPMVDETSIDLVLVPGLCYDRLGNRLGFGGGYFDRWLAGFSGFRVGLCRHAILRDQLPIEGHDIRVNMVLTEEECLSGFAAETGGA